MLPWCAPRGVKQIRCSLATRILERLPRDANSGVRTGGTEVH